MRPRTIGFVFFTYLLGFCLLISVPLHAQVSGASVSGTITDPQGGAVPAAAVAVKNIATEIVLEVTTNAVGFYTVPNLAPGDYEVSVSAPGFSTSITKVTLTVGAKRELDLTLNIGQVQEAVEVVGAAALSRPPIRRFPATSEAMRFGNCP